MAVDSGECKSCSELFDKCGKCDSDKCSESSEKEGWILTDNGCYKPDEPSPSSGVTPSSSHQSKPIVPSSSSSHKKGSKAGMIVGIVIGVLAAVAIIAIAIYCVVTSGPKHGKIDSGIYEEDPHFTSMSVL